MKISKLSLPFLGFIQAVSIFIYCSIVGLFLWKGEMFFGDIPNFTAPLLALVMLVVSVLICALLAFGYPAILYWDKKDTESAVKIVAFTALWMVLVIIVMLIMLVIF